MQKKISHVRKVEPEVVERAQNVTIQWMIGEDDNAPCYMRLFTFGIDGRMPLHQHANVGHVQYYLKGKMKVTIGGEEHSLTKGNFLYVPKNVPHAYENVGEEEAQFICIIPPVKDTHTELLSEKE